MSDSTAQTETRSDARKSNKRRPIIAFALATLAVGGVGAALTSAAWTDNVFFSASADAATFDLQGSLDGTTFVQSDNKDKIELVVPETTFAKLLPGQTRTVTLYVKNLGNVSAKLSSSVEWSTDTTFVEKPGAVVSDLALTLAPADSKGDVDAFTLTVTAPEKWDVANKGTAGTIIVTVSGEATS